MDDLSTYRLSDFILFSETSYYRLYENYNQAIWPLHIVAGLFAGLIIIAACKKPYENRSDANEQKWAGRISAAVLVISWLWVAYVFLYQRFYQIHVVANWYALGFVVQAGLIGWFGLLKDRFARPCDNGIREMTSMLLGLLFIAAGILIYPFIAFITGRPWQQFEMFALAPDPTALVTLGILLFYKVYKSGAARILFVIPVSWLVISYTTLVVM